MALYAHVENGSITYRGSLPKNWKNVSNLHLSEGDTGYLATIGFLPYIEVNATISEDETPDGWTDVITATKVTSTEQKRTLSAEEIASRDMNQWITAMISLEMKDNMSRWFEDYITENSVTFGAGTSRSTYDAKIALRATKPAE
jgi:hypothetical protein